MRALLCREFAPPEQLRLEDIPLPRPGNGQVRIEVKACALNYPDALMVEGRYQVKPPLPFVPGAEVAGVVAELGEGVTQWTLGQAVIGLPGTGGLAESCLVAAERLLPLPEGMSFEQGAALVLTYGTALHALADRGQLHAGETLLVLGAAGGVGAAAIEIGKALGARVIAAASSDEKLALARDLGADATINYAREDLRERALAIAGKEGVDVVFDPVGGAFAEAALRAMAWRGRFLVIGFAAGDIPKLPLNLALLKERSLVGVFWGEAVRRDPARHAHNMHRLFGWFAEGKIKPAVTDRLGLSVAAIGLRRLLDRQARGKIVVLP